MAKPKAIITGHDGREVSIITKAENVLFDNGDTAQSILETDHNKTFTPTIESSKSMFKVGQGDSVDYSLNVVDGAYESCVLKGVTKYIDKDTNEILDTFIEGRNLSLIDVKSPILTNVNMLDTLQEGYKSNILTCETYFDEASQSDKSIVLRSLPDGICDTLNVETAEYIVEIGERVYQVGDLELLDVYTDGVTTHYKLATPIVHKVSLSGYPYAHKDGYVILSSGSTEQSLTPNVEYSLPINRTGQIQVNQKMVEKQQKQLDYLEKIIVANVVVSEYEQTLSSLNYELSRV